MMVILHERSRRIAIALSVLTLSLTSLLGAGCKEDGDECVVCLLAAVSGTPAGNAGAGTGFTSLGSFAAAAAAEPNFWTGVTYGNGLFVATASSGTNRVMTSPDGINWTARTAAEANFWQSVTYANGLFIAVAGTGANRAMTSLDGINWTAHPAAEANGWQSVVNGGSRVVAVAAVAGGGTNQVMYADLQ